MIFEGSIKIVQKNRQYFHGVDAAYTKQYVVFRGVDTALY